jgi:hypothetical protein
MFKGSFELYLARKVMEVCQILPSRNQTLDDLQMALLQIS